MRKMLIFRKSDNCIGVTIVSKDNLIKDKEMNARYSWTSKANARSSEFLITKDEIKDLLKRLENTKHNFERVITRDIRSFCEIGVSLNYNELHFEFTWLGSSGNDLKGHREILILDLEKFVSWYNSDTEILKLLEKNTKKTFKLDIRCDLKEVLANKIVKNKFRSFISKLCYQEGVMTLYSDYMKYSFYFVKDSKFGGKYNGGIIFHKSNYDLVERYGKYNNNCEITSGRYGIHT